MPFYEVIYETGAHSVAEYEDDDEARRAIQAHHDRAAQGMPAQEGLDRPAERVVKAFRYEEHPAAFKVKVSAKDVKVSGDDIDVMELAAKIRDLASPLVVSDPHESNYKAEGEPLDWEA